MTNTITHQEHRDDLAKKLKNLRNKKDKDILRRSWKELAENLLRKEKKNDVYKISNSAHQNDHKLAQHEKELVKNHKMELDNKNKEIENKNETIRTVNSIALKQNKMLIEQDKWTTETDIVQNKNINKVDLWLLPIDVNKDVENMPIEEINKTQEDITEYSRKLKNYEEKLAIEKRIQERGKAIECPTEITQEFYEKAKNDIDSRYSMLKGNMGSARTRASHDDYQVRDMITDKNFVTWIVVACKKEDIETVEKSLCMIESCVKLRHFDWSNSDGFLSWISALKRNPEFKATSKLIYDTWSSLINKNREDMKKYLMRSIKGKEKERIQELITEKSEWYKKEAKYFMTFVGVEKEKIESLIDEYLNNDCLGSKYAEYAKIEEICHVR